jgi:hypothetical protein
MADHYVPVKPICRIASVLNERSRDQPPIDDVGRVAGDPCVCGRDE